MPLCFGGPLRRSLSPLCAYPARTSPQRLTHAHSTPTPLHSLDEKIKKLDAQLIPLREQIRRARPGPAQEAAKRRALQVRG